MQHVTVILSGDTLSLIFSSHLLVFLLFFAYLKLFLSVHAALDCIKVGWEEPAGKWFGSQSVRTSTSCVCVCVRAPSPLQTFHPLWAPSICHHQSRALVIPLPPWWQQPASSSQGPLHGDYPRGLPGQVLQTCKKCSLRILTYQSPGPPFSLGASFVLVPMLKKSGTHKQVERAFVLVPCIRLSKSWLVILKEKF